MLKITLAAARVNAGLRQNEVAKALGVSVRTLVRWEKGLSLPDARQIEKICELYGIAYEAINFTP